MFTPAQAQYGDIASMVVVNPTRCPGLKRQISMDTFPTATARSLPTVRPCHTYSHREPHIRCTRRQCLLNIPRPRSLPDITMGCTRCHHVRLLNPFRVRYPTPTFLSAIRLLLPRLLPQAQANRQSSWSLRSVATLSHLLQMQIKRKMPLQTSPIGRLQPASVPLHPLPTASRALPVPSIQNLEASMNTRQTSIHIHDASRSKLSLLFASLRSRLLTSVSSSVLDHFSNLGIEGQITASPTDSANRSPEQAHTSENASGVNTVYASPRPNTSNGDSPHPPTEPVRFLLTSELASALSSNTDGPASYVSC